MARAFARRASSKETSESNNQRLWLIGNEINSGQGLRALESVFPWDDEADWRAVLIQQRFSINAGREEG
jgi:hypothetical protein